MAKNSTLPIPADEEDRLRSLIEYQILDTANDQHLDELTHFTAHIFNVPIVLITLIDQHRQWFKSSYGLDLKETLRVHSFCQYTIMSNEVLEIYDTLEDERFEKNPLVAEDPKMRFYCGAPLINEKGYKLGALALIDKVPRKLDPFQRQSLSLIAQQVVNFFELRLKSHMLEKEKALLENKVKERTAELEQKMKVLRRKDRKLKSLNNELNQLIYKASHDLLGPLKTMQGITYLALQEMDAANIHKYLNLLNITTQKLDSVLVHLIKLVAVRDVSSVAPVNWQHVIDNALVKAIKRVPDKAIDLTTNISSTRTFISDQSMLEMVLEELLVNSMQYHMEAPVSVTINVYEEKDNECIEITDNGIGIKEEGGSVFEMFYKGLDSKGSGLGLYIVKNAVKKLHGRIRFKSKRNNGTTFRIHLPIGISLKK